MALRNRIPGSPSTWPLLKAALVAGLAFGVTSAASCAPDGTSTSSGRSSGSGNGGSNGSGGAGGTAEGSGGNGAGGATSSSSSSSSSSSGMMGCKSDADCVGNAGGALCDTGTGKCVPCLPTNDTCPQGQFCDPKKDACLPGCTDDTDCDVANGLVCDVASNSCVGCTSDANCAAGSICIGSTCIPGCNPQHDCVAGFSCCANTCFDLANDVEHCGACDLPCLPTPHAATTCSSGMCTPGMCDAAWADCDGTSQNGCERNTLQDGPCLCAPNAVQSCYLGAPGTMGVGPCKAGTQTCAADGLSWGACVGQVLPKSEICNNAIDEDCNGILNDAADLDGDGWGRCDGDCCDSLSDGCVDPKLVNPGAFDFVGNGFDDDCNGVLDDSVATCDAGLASNSAVGLDYAKAIDLCATTTENPAVAQKKWGVISASFTLADGAGAPAAVSRSIRSGFGSNVVPLKGSKIAVISTGNAAAQNAPNNTNPPYATFETGVDTLTTSGFPADWLAANGGNVPNAPNCPAPSGATAYNPVMLKVRVRVPTNAKSFNVSSFFYSAEYPEYVCTPFNDFYLTLLDSGYNAANPRSPTLNPVDKNLAFYDPPPAGKPYYPIGVNLAVLNNGLFQQCKNGPTGCSGVNPGNINTCVSTSQLVGTGFDIVQSGCVANNLLGGGTGWLTTSGNVVPGEKIDLRFVIWDTSDGVWDSLALIDQFVWSAAPATPGTHL